MALTKTPIELSSTPGIVDNSNATAITIDSSENVLVGTTTTNIATEGTVIYGAGNEGVVTLSSTNMTALYVNRSTDGELVQFRQGGSTVAGSIGGGATFLTIGSGTGNVYFQNGVMAPTASSGGASSNGVVDIGTASSRFKDIYLSGGAYLGGTAAANKLEDYEEGTFTVGFTGAAISAPNTTGIYTKIGRQVYWTYYSHGSTISGASGTAIMTGLPFTVQNSANAYQPFFTAHNTFFGGSATVGVSGYHSIGATTLVFVPTGTANTSTYVNGSGKYIMISGFYLTDA